MHEHTPYYLVLFGVVVIGIVIGCLVAGGIR